MQFTAPEPRNYGFAGMAISLPQVVDNVDRTITGAVGDAESIDRTLNEVGRLTYTLTVNLYQLGKSLRYERDSYKVHDASKNLTTYKDTSGIKSIIRTTIEKMYRYSIVLGEDTLLLLENMWCYLKLVSDEEPDEFAYDLAKVYHNAVKE